MITARTKRTNNWLTNNHHGIRWQDGDVDYRRFADILRRSIPAGSKVYVKGDNKMKFLGKLLDMNIIDVGGLDCPSFPTLVHQMHTCFHHGDAGPAAASEKDFTDHCAYYKALKVFKWVKDNME
jgi:hypothetical protein